MSDDEDVLNKANAFLSRSQRRRSSDFPILTETVPDKDVRAADSPFQAQDFPKVNNGGDFELDGRILAQASNRMCASLLELLEDETRNIANKRIDSLTEKLKQEILAAVFESLSNSIPSIVTRAIDDCYGAKTASPPSESSE